MYHKMTDQPTSVISEIQIHDRDLPMFPPMAVRTLRLLHDPSINNGYFARLLQQDDELHLTERILRVANSAYYSPRIPIRNLADAISRLGRRQLYDLIVVAAVGKLYDSHDPYIQMLWNHAIAAGITCLMLAKSYHCAFVNEAFLAGVLHDIGKLIVYQRYPFLYWRYWCEEGSIHRQLETSEAADFPSLSHSIIGARIIQKWNLSGAIADSTRLHHVLENSIPTDRPECMFPCIVSLANIIVNNLGIIRPVNAWPETVSLACAQYLKFKIEHVKPIRERLEEIFDIHNANLDCDPKFNSKEIQVTV